jgi:hypothetical protein
MFSSRIIRLLLPVAALATAVTLAAAGGAAASSPAPPAASAPERATIAGQGPVVAPVTVSPNRPNAPSRMLVRFQGQVPIAPFNLSAPLPPARILFARGFRWDFTVLPGRCSQADARAFRCARASRFGGGSVLVVLSGGDRVNLDVNVYAGPTGAAGTPISITLTGPGTRVLVEGILRRTAQGQYGSELVAQRFQGEVPAIAAGGSVRSAVLGIGLTRTVNGARRTVLRNPPTCRGGAWPYRAQVDVGVTVAFDGGIACRRAARPSPSPPRPFTG